VELVGKTQRRSSAAILGIEEVRSAGVEGWGSAGGDRARGMKWPRT
jgi:hypothetical protein